MENLDFNFTVLIQLANFLVTLAVLNFLLIRPIREQIKKRKEITDGYTKDISNFVSLAEDKISSYEKSLDDAREKATKVRDSLKVEGRSQEHNVLLTAQNDAQQYLKKNKEALATEIQETTKALTKDIPRFAKEAVSKILG